jgi:type II secretory ATPase GspE/PulE/Tfp pilus assembly ATPase PilB-like protein
LTVSQRLVRRLCPDCAEPAELTAAQMTRAVELAREGGLDFDLLERKFRRPVGCAKCKGIGYRGQTLVAEVLEMSDEIGQALRKGDLAKQLRTIAVGQGMTTMGADGVRRAAAGQTTIDEVLRALAV